MTVAPAVAASRHSSSTSAALPTAYPRVKPPQASPAEVTPLSSASLPRSHSETIIGPAWNMTMSPSVNADRPAEALVELAGAWHVGHAEGDDVESLVHGVDARSGQAAGSLEEIGHVGRP